MTKDDSQRFVEVLTLLGEVFSHRITPAMIDAYHMALKRFEIDEIARAGARIVESSRFFPKPVEFIEAIQGDPGERAVKAWSIAWNAVSSVGAYRSPSFEDAAISRAIQAMGGWVAFCRPTEDEQWWRKRFCEIYQSEDGHIGIAPRLIGEHEVTNRATGQIQAGEPEGA